ncbi:MAG TPA: FAD-dependent oxidoreductase [Nocardioidaceae bacterium]|nr:FAD-dependent oxidoreductase [Nocardioidaceae bacterium]
MEKADLLVIGAGPYAYAAAAFAEQSGIDVRIVGRPMAFWREQMPAGMFLRSGSDWHLDAAGEHTFEAYFEDRGLSRADLDPIPIAVFLDYTEWFRERKALRVEDRLLSGLAKADGTFVATMEDGSMIAADKVLAAPGIRHFANLPTWYEAVPSGRRAHTSELVSFEDLAGARVVVVGGRQSAYEWAALLCDHGAERVDVVHRHATPMFARVSWTFVDRHIEQTLAHRGWWRRLPAEEQEAIAAKFWQVGRLTLEPWLVPRLSTHVVISHPGCEVTDVAAGEDYATLRLSDGQTCSADFVVFASGYKADLGRVPYLGPVLPEVSATNGFPDLSEGFETSLPGLYMTGFVSTRDFGPFFGFTKGCPASAHIAVTEMQR